MQHRSPEATVGAIITRQESGTEYVLLVLRGTEPYQNYWSLPGGHIDPFEKVEHAVIREVKEEVGLNLEPRFLFYFDEIIPNLDIHAVVHVFDGKATGTIKLMEGEILDSKWIVIEDAMQMALAFFHRDIIEKYIEERSCK
ncbi:MAG: NUDIX hydrolase [bacterium]|jgi:ADP-ribose pyrophosphatase YjhB (NUDIX family)|nr:NUDIX hydrolase [bacterium]